MRFGAWLRGLVLLPLVVALGCGSGGGSAGRKPAFLDQKKEVGPRLEWSREVTAKSGGVIEFRVSSPGPFAVTVVTAKGYQAAQGSGGKKVAREDVLLTADCKGTAYDGKVTLPAGSSYFIIENQTDKNAEIRLECFPP
jgi:hypothetical protein